MAAIDQVRNYGGVLLMAGLAWALPASADSEIERLRAENLQLKQQLQALQRACPIAAAPAVPVAPSPAVPAVPIASAPAAATAAAVAPGAAASPPAPRALPQPPQVPEGYKLVKIDALQIAQDKENCQRGLFGRTQDAPWKHGDAWLSLSKKMKPEQVEATLGKNHTTIDEDGERTMWEYGKCGADSPGQAFVVFDRAGLLFWQAPED